MRTEFIFKNVKIEILKILNYLHFKILQVEVSNISSETIDFDISKIKIKNGTIRTDERSSRSSELSDFLQEKLILIESIKEKKEKEKEQKEIEKDIEKDIEKEKDKNPIGIDQEQKEKEKKEKIEKEKDKVKKIKNPKLKKNEKIIGVLVLEYNNYSTNNINIIYDDENLSTHNIERKEG